MENPCESPNRLAVTFEDDGTFPNSRLPLLLYPKALDPAEARPEVFEALFARNGWPPQWISGIYPFHHYHSTAHECLGIAGVRRICCSEARQGASST